jgi:hypothetical protein
MTLRLKGEAFFMRTRVTHADTRTQGPLPVPSVPIPSRLEPPRSARAGYSSGYRGHRDREKQTRFVRVPALRSGRSEVRILCGALGKTGPIHDRPRSAWQFRGSGPGLLKALAEGREHDALQHAQALAKAVLDDPTSVLARGVLGAGPFAMRKAEELAELVIGGAGAASPNGT